MKNKLFISLVLLSFQSFAADTFNLVTEFSSLSFATIKKQYVVEPATISGLTGSVDSSGQFAVIVPVANIDTDVAIRNERLNSLFFNSSANPVMMISGKFDLASLTQPISKVLVPANVSFYDTNKTFNFPVIITKTDHAITVHSYAPVIVKASDFGIPAANLTKLAATVDGLALSDAVPVNINLVFNK
ncbi:MAG: YceI family protein [Moritella sp.]|uniref:YceI family protein n=1 Tax=Moritella sp. TaxID=78556 RepID=UPI0029A759BA|nr:YceI family protein [Moritella sp.]MDX2319649.1 YceI family protein [Moritella sp.]